MSLPSEIEKKVRLLELSIRKKVNHQFLGEYHSAFKGQGMTFSEFREYVPGDDVRTISWPVTARTGKPFIKKFDEERELNVVLAVDISGSTEFGSQNILKAEAIAQLSALIGFCASRNNDHVGMVLFSDQIEHWVPPKKSRGHIHRILRDIFYFQPSSKGTKILSVVDFLQSSLKKRSYVFIISDFMDQDYAHSLRMLGKKHDVVALMIRDPLEEKLPDLGLIDFYDPESGEVLVVDSSSSSFRQKYEAQMLHYRKTQKEELVRSQVDCVEISTGQDIVDPLITYFKRRAGR